MLGIPSKTSSANSKQKRIRRGFQTECHALKFKKSPWCIHTAFNLVFLLDRDEVKCFRDVNFRKHFRLLDVAAKLVEVGKLKDILKCGLIELPEVPARPL